MFVQDQPSTCLNFPVIKALQASAMHGVAIDPNEVQTYLTLVQAASEFIRHHEAFFSRYQLSSGRFSILLALHQSATGALTPSECAEQVDLKKGTISGLLNGLDHQGLILRQRHPTDRRKNQIKISESGQNLLQKLFPGYYARITQVMTDLERFKQD